jgi:hypothetical protein
MNRFSAYFIFLSNGSQRHNWSLGLRHFPRRRDVDFEMRSDGFMRNVVHPRFRGGERPEEAQRAADVRRDP